STSCVGCPGCAESGRRREEACFRNGPARGRSAVVVASRRAWRARAAAYAKMVAFPGPTRRRPRMSTRFQEIDWRPTPLGDISLRRRRDPVSGEDVYEVKLGEEFL